MAGESFVLEDFERDILTGEIRNEVLQKMATMPRSRTLGRWVVGLPFEAHTRVNLTGPPGAVMGTYFSLVFQLRKWEYMVQRADEWIEVSPVHAQYYQITQKQKEELEARIKQGLGSISQMIADWELVRHDERKYREFLNYFGLEFNDNEFKERKEKRDEHSVKAVFIDLVDVHTGEGISMRSIVSRWPTLITDFMKLSDDDMDPSNVMKKLDVSKAEAVVLVTKNKLYNQWKQLFEPEIRTRYRSIIEVMKSREESVKQYRDWLKPYIAKHKTIQEGLLNPGRREMLSTLFVSPAGQAVSLNMIELWVWKDFAPIEIFRGGTEEAARLTAEGRLTPYDEWTKRNVIFHKGHGLVTRYPWITDIWVKEQLNYIYNRTNPRWMLRHKYYYTFFVIRTEKSNIRMPTGAELEDGIFDVNAIMMSQNALFAKLLELRAKQADFNMYVDSLLGLHRMTKPEEMPPRMDWKKPVSDFFGKFSLAMQFAKAGPYEKDFDDRLTKVYFAGMARERYSVIVSFIKRKMGAGG